ncbi:MAG: protein kinase [Polyangiaceae bacterium]|nr:protein kinase [Polyangiaceae bacterium]
MAPDPEIADDRSGQTVGGRWQLIRFLGSGGMASVYEATDASGQRVAIKLLHPEMARKRELKERFLREAYVANRIGHPGIVRVLDHADGSDVFLVLELLEGEPMGARMQRTDQFTVRDLLGHADQILSALGAAHAAGVVHRDIKPDNVFVLTTGQIKILDFGIARVIDDVPSEFKTRTGLALGTIPYMAPEQALGRRGKVDGRTDLFALGALMFRALAGRRIHEAPSEAELLVAMATMAAPRLAEVAPGAPPAVCAIVDRALAFSQEARYPDAATMQLDVRAVLSGALPSFAMAASARADEATRVEGPASLREAPTAVSPAPLVIAEPPRSQAPYSLAGPPSAAATPAAFVSDAVPASLPPYSLAGPPSAAATHAAFVSDAVPASLPPYSIAGGPPAVAAPAPARARPRSAVAFVVVAALGLLALGAVAVVGVFLFRSASADAAATGAPQSAAPPSAAASASPPPELVPDPSGAPLEPATAPVATAPSKPGSSAAKSAAPAPSGAAAQSAALAPTTSAPTAQPAASTSPSAAPPPAPSSEPKGDPGKGKGKSDKKLSKPK